MKDRLQAKSSTYRLHPFLQTLTSSTPTQPHLRAFDQVNCLKSIGDRRRRADRLTSNRQVKAVSQDSLILPRIETSSARSERKSQTNTSTSSSTLVLERVACEISMIYVPTEPTKTAKSHREEILIIQQHSPNDTSLVYRGYLTKDDLFSFKCQRRPTSSLSLAFYIEGALVHVINDCCEFSYAQKIPTTTDKKQFSCQDVSMANPCEKCRKDHATKLMTNNTQNTLLVQHKEPVQSSLVSKVVLHEKKPEQPPVVSSAVPRLALDLPLSLSTGNSDTGYSKPSKVEFKLPIQLIQAPKATRHANSVENFCYVIEKNLAVGSDEQEILDSLINLGFPVENINSTETVQLLKTIHKERIIYILSKASMENLNQSIRDEPLLSAIYLIDSAETSCSFDSKFYRGSFPNLTELCQQLKRDLQSMTYGLTKTACIPVTYKRMSTLNYAQALIDILVQADTRTDLKKDMLEFCREEYAHNKRQLKLIDEFEKDFQAEQAIEWYLREEGFLYKMLTRAFRRLDADILYKCRYFIQSLYAQMKSHVEATELTVYQTLRMRKDEFEKIEQYKDGFLSFNEFLLVDKSLPTIDLFPVNTESKVVQFHIKVGNDICRYETPDPSNKVLLNMGTVFHISTVEQIDHNTYKVQLKTDEEIVRTVRMLTDDLLAVIRSPYPLVRMAQLMKQKDLPDYIEYFSLMLINDAEALKDRSVSLVLGGLCHSLGTSSYERKQYDPALKHLHNALNIYKQCLDENDVKLSPTYNNIGSIYHKQGLDEQALAYHQKAYDIQRNSTNPDISSISAYVGNIASVLIKLGRHQESLQYLIIDLKIKQKRYPNNDHTDLSSRYFNVAGAYHRIQKYPEALENYGKCLEIELKHVLKTDPTVAVTYYNMAATLEKLDRLEDARDAVTRAIERLLLTKSKDDEEVQTQERYLKKLENKVIMQSVFGAKN